MDDSRDVEPAREDAVPPDDSTPAEGAREERQALLDRMTDAVFGLDPDWRFTYLNERARSIVCEAVGRDLPAETLRGQSIRDLLPDLLDTAFGEAYREAMATQEVVTVEEYYDPLDAWFDVRAYPSETGVSVYFRDVTDERRRREALDARESVLRDVYETFSRPDWSLERRVAALLEIGRDVLGTRYGTLSRVDDDRYAFEVVSAPDGDDSVQPGDVVDLEATNCERTVLSEGTLVLSDVARDAPELTERAGFTEMGIRCYVGTPVIERGDVHGTFCFYDTEPREEPFSDWEVTLVDLMGKWVSYALEREVAEEELVRQSDRLEEFATLVSHDLRNPLSVARGYLDLVGEECDSEHLAAVDRAHDRMERLVDDVLTLAREGRVVEEATDLDLGTVAADAWDGVPTAEATLRTADGPPVVAEEGRLRRLLENLFRNSVEHAGPDVTVRVGRLPGGFYVEDDGPGIPPDRRDEVFETGVSTSGEGTGFGLAIVAEIAAAHGWSVAVAASDAGGARFEFEGVRTQ